MKAETEAYSRALPCAQRWEGGAAGDGWGGRAH